MAIKLVEQGAQQEAQEVSPPEQQKPADEPAAAAEKPAAEADKALDDIKSLLAKDQRSSRVKREMADAKAKAVEEMRARAQADKVSVLRELGIDPQSLITDYLMNGGKAEQKPEEPDPSKLPPEIVELREELSRVKAALSQRDEKEQSSYLQSQRNDALSAAKQFATSDPEKYEMISSAGDQGAGFLVDVLVAKYRENEDYYRENNTSPGFQDVAEGVEKYMLEQARQQLEWMSKLKKLQPVIKDFAGRLVSPTSTKPAKSLDNDISAEGSDEVEPKNDEERVKLAIRKLELLNAAKK